MRYGSLRLLLALSGSNWISLNMQYTGSQRRCHADALCSGLLTWMANDLALVR